MSWKRSLSAVLPGPLWDVKKRYLVTQSPLDCIRQLVSAACVTTPQPPPLCTDFVQFSGSVTYSPLLQEQLSDDTRWEKPSDGCLRQLVRAPWGCCKQEQLKGTASIWGERSLGTASRATAFHIFSWDNPIKYQFGEDAFFTGTSQPLSIEHKPFKGECGGLLFAVVNLILVFYLLSFIIYWEERVNNCFPRNLDGCGSSQKHLVLLTSS